MNAEEEIQQLITWRSEASIEGDTEKLEELLAPEFRYINRWGDVLQRAVYFTKKSESDNSSYWIAQDIDEMQIMMIDDDVAIASFRVLDHQMFEGAELKDYVRTTYVCRYDGDRWWLAFGQTSTVEPE